MPFEPPRFPIRDSPFFPLFPKTDMSELKSEKTSAEEDYALACDYETGTNEITQSIETFIRLLKSSADKGYALAQLRLSRVYRRGFGIPPNQIEAERYAIAAASQNYLPAIGICYDFGYGVPKNQDNALEMQMAAHRSGDVMGTLHAAFEYMARDDYKTACDFLMIGCDAGDLDCISQLAHCYKFGMGVGMDRKRGFELMQIAAKKGDVDAYCRLGCSYYNGEGTAANSMAGFHWHWRAAQQNHSVSQFRLAVAYFKGLAEPEGVIDVEAGFKWLRKSAANGKRQAMGFLGRLYEFGSKYLPAVPNATRADPEFEVAVDLRKAVECYRLDIPKLATLGGTEHIVAAQEALKRFILFSRPRSSRSVLIFFRADM